METQNKTKKLNWLEELKEDKNFQKEINTKNYISMRWGL